MINLNGKTLRIFPFSKGNLDFRYVVSKIIESEKFAKPKSLSDRLKPPRKKLSERMIHNPERNNLNKIDFKWRM